ncbi:unnamed protein product [Amoebophrya sp. A25]|nr:unnamed protein product [Amoebophrya sp. A25]|eukprot:GSA25T00009072001.1
MLHKNGDEEQNYSAQPLRAVASTITTAGVAYNDSNTQGEGEESTPGSSSVSRMAKCCWYRKCCNWVAQRCSAFYQRSCYWQGYLTFYLVERSYGWLMLDFFVVFVTGIEITFSILLYTGVLPLDTIDIVSALRVFAVARILRCTKLFRYSPDLRLVNAFRTIVWIVLMLGTFIYVNALILVRFIGQDDDFVAREPENIGEKFGTVRQAIYYLFVAFTLENWPEIAEPFRRAVSPQMSWYFVFFICCTNFTIFSLVVAITLQNIRKIKVGSKLKLLRDIAREKLEIKRSLVALFRELDADESGEVSLDEFRALVIGNKILEGSPPGAAGDIGQKSPLPCDKNCMTTSTSCTVVGEIGRGAVVDVSSPAVANTISTGLSSSATTASATAGSASVVETATTAIGVLRTTSGVDGEGRLQEREVHHGTRNNTCNDARNCTTSTETSESTASCKEEYNANKCASAPEQEVGSSAKRMRSNFAPKVARSGSDSTVDQVGDENSCSTILDSCAFSPDSKIMADSHSLPVAFAATSVMEESTTVMKEDNSRQEEEETRDDDSPASDGRHRMTAHERLAQLHIDPSELEWLFTILDRDGSGTISEAEFVQGIETLTSSEHSRQLLSCQSYVLRALHTMFTRRTQRIDILAQRVKSLNEFTSLPAGDHEQDHEGNAQLISGDFVPAASAEQLPASEQSPLVPTPSFGRAVGRSVGEGTGLKAILEEEDEEPAFTHQQCYDRAKRTAEETVASLLKEDPELFSRFC